MNQNKKNIIIIFSGLLGCGKTTMSKYIHSKYENYVRFNTDDVRRILGKKKYDRKDVPQVNEYMYSRARKLLREGKGIIFDSAYRTKVAREKIYDIGKEFRVPVLVVECFCKPETAMKRISSRINEDGLYNPTNDPGEYLKYAKIFEKPWRDFNDSTNHHVSWARLNTEDNYIEVMGISKGHEEIIKENIKFIEEQIRNFKNI